MKIIAIFLLVSAITFLTRVLPFLLFKDKEKTPKIVYDLGEVLPMAMIAMLIIYCLKDMNLLGDDHGLPYILAIISVVLIHEWKRNTLLSIAISTIIYMFLVQFIF